MRPLLRSASRRAAAYLTACTLLSAGVAVPATPAIATASCVVTYHASHWTNGPGAGGFQANVSITNAGAALTGWTLGLTLPAGHSLQTGWSAAWAGSTGEITATNRSWNATIGAGGSVELGFLGRWSGAFVDNATAFEVNGVPCGGKPPPNRPPTVSISSPNGSSIVLPGPPLVLSAQAGDPDGTVEVVQFFVNDVLVGTDRTAPYEVQVAALPVGANSFTAFARAFDDGSPSLAADSAKLRFFVVTVPPLSIVAPAALAVTEGGTATFDLRLSAPGASAEVALTVAGAPGVTVAPASVRLDPGQPTRQITVTAAPDSGGTVATVTAAADPSQRIGSARVTVTVRDGELDPVANPYRGAEVYVNPDWAARVSEQSRSTPGELGRQMARVATYPTAVWLDAIDAITDGRGLVGHLDAALDQQRRSGAGPVVVQLVLSNIPARHCIGWAAPGELTLDAADQQRYRTDFIDPIAVILSRPRYANLRVVTIIEPGALPSAAFSAAGQPQCVAAPNAYVAAVRYALTRLGALDNTFNYLEFAYSGIFGHPDTLTRAAGLYAQIVNGPGGPGAGSVTGFATNVRQYAPLSEPFIPSGETLVGGMPVYQSSFYDWNRQVHELSFAQAARVALIGSGFDRQVGMVIDTSRNGWGGPARPTGPSTSSALNTFVDQSRIDRRPTRLAWCNQAGAGIGVRPAAEPAPGIHAYAWLTPPGESDGAASAAAPPDPARPFLRHRSECDPDRLPVRAAVVPTNALPGAPHAGRWFPAFFAQLVANAHPTVRTP
ncbi:MAG TPA: glycoside hydrolase family 6 protein [Catenuloplanes sp.]|jgi:cellulose 1,4-beta-cellobiosidase